MSKIYKEKDLFSVCLDCQDLDASWAKMKDSAAPYKGFYVEAGMTHADKLINNRIYFRDKMEKAAPSFIHPYKKPVLRHHDDGQDPIGRVVKVEFVNTQDPSLVRFCNLSSDKMRDLYVHYLTDNFLFKEGYEGTGFLLGGLDITEKDAIEKIMDERYMTLSIGFGTNKRVCSYCGTDWISEMPCEHFPGSEVDGVKVFHLTGDLTYNEVSFVNEPADPSAQILKTVGIDANACPYCLDTVADKLTYLKDKVEELSMFEEMLNLIKSGQKVSMEDFLVSDGFDADKLYEFLISDSNCQVNTSELKDSEFARAGRILPIVDQNHFEAIRKLLMCFEDTKEKERTVNRLYYRARKLGLLPSSSIDFVVTLNGEEKKFDVTNKDAVLAAYKELHSVFETLPEENKEFFDSRTRILNITKDMLEEVVKVEQTADSTTDSTIPDAQSDGTDAANTADVQAPVENKVSTIDELYTMFAAWDEEKQDEFRSLVDNSGAELSKMADILATHATKQAQAETEKNVVQSELTAAKATIESLRNTIIDTVKDYRILLNKSIADDNDAANELSGRTMDSLMDTLADLRRELMDNFGCRDNKTSTPAADEPRRNGTDTVEKLGSLAYDEFNSKFFRVR